jgi:ankyrin repeat protein
VNRGLQENQQKTKALHLAMIPLAQPEVITSLLALHADPDTQDEDGDTPLHLAILQVQDREALGAIVRALLDAGASTELRNAKLRTPLLEAAETSEVEVVEALVEHGADAHVRSASGRSALSLSPDPRLFSYFLNLGLDPLLVDNQGVCQLHYGLAGAANRSVVLSHPHLLAALPPVPAGAAVTAPDLVLEIFPHLASILSRIARLGRRTEGWVDLHPDGAISPLCLAARYGRVKAVQSLLSAGAGVDFEGCEEGTALMAACAMGHLETVQVLVQQGASVAYVSDKGGGVTRSALAVARPFPRIVRWLLVDRWSRPTCRRIAAAETDSEGAVPLFYAWSGIRTASVKLTRDDQTWAYSRGYAGFAARNSMLRGLVAGRVQSGIRLVD